MSERLLTLDFGIVALYLLITLAVGIVKGRGVKTMEHFAIGHKERYGTAILVATLFASETEATVTMHAAQVFSIGMISVAVFFGTSINHLLTARFIAPHAGRFRGMISAGDMMESFYGKTARFITGFATFFWAMSIFPISIGVICHICEYFFGLSRFAGAIIGAEIVVIYSCFGGVKSVTYTDIIQFSMLIVVIPMISIIGVYSLGGTNAFLEQVPSDKASFFPPASKQMDYLYLFLWFCIPYLRPYNIQRLLMARDSRQAVSAFKTAGILIPPTQLLIGCIALIALCLDPKVSPNFAFFHVMETTLPVVFRGIAIAGMLAIAMGSADSILNATSVSLAHDVVKPLHPSLTNHSELKLARIFNVLIGNLAIFVVISYENIYDILGFGGWFWTPMILAPFMLGVMGIQASSRSFLLAAVAGLCTTLLWKGGWIQGYGLMRASLIPSLMMSTTLLLLARCFDPPEKRGCFDNPFAGTNPLSPKKLIDRYVWTPGKHMRFSRQQEQFYGIPVTESVWVAAVIQLLPYVHIDPKAPHFFWLLGLRVTALLLCTLMGLRAYLPLGLVQRYLAAYWMVVMPYAALVVPVFALFCGGGAVEDFAFVCVGGLMLTHIVHPGVILRLHGGCVLLGWLGYRLVGGAHGWLSVATEIGPALLIIAVLGFVVTWRFSRSRESIMRGALASSQLREKVAAHESKRPLMHCRDSAMPLREDMEELVRAHKKLSSTDPEFKSKTPGRYKLLETAIRDIEDQSQEGITFLSELLDKVKDPLNVAPKADIVSAKECVMLAMAYGNFSKGITDRLTVDMEADYQLCGNKFFWAQLVVNVLENAGQHTDPNDWIKLWLQPPGKYSGFGKICCRNSGKVIPTAQLPHVFDEDFSQREGGTGTGTAFCKNVARASDGEAYVFSNPAEKTTTFEFWTPRVTDQMRKEVAARQEKERQHHQMVQEALQLAYQCAKQRDEEAIERMMDERYGKKKG